MQSIQNLNLHSRLDTSATVLIVIMIGGSLWIGMGLHSRMTVPVP